MKNEPYRILYVFGGVMGRGGTEAYMMNYYRNMDRDKIQIDFIIHGFEKGVYDEEIKTLGGKIYNIPVKSKSFSKNIIELRKILKTNHYKLVHSHMDAMGMLVLKIAKQCGIPIRIAHSHSTQHQTNNKLKYALNELARKKITKYATHLFACSEAAGQWLYGEKAYKSGKVTIIKNAIDLDRFGFDPQVRTNLRKELNLDNDFVMGHVGRLSNEKNHAFLIHVFHEGLKKIPNSKLILIGEGPLREEIHQKIKELDMEEHVLLLGARSDVHELLNTLDLFILPSFFEGLPLVIVEAQANGLPCLLSDTIPQEVKIADTVSFLSLDNSPEQWATEIEKGIAQGIIKRQDNTEAISRAGYNIQKEAKKLEDLYIDLLESNK